MTIIMPHIAIIMLLFIAFAANILNPPETLPVIRLPLLWCILLQNFRDVKYKFAFFLPAELCNGLRKDLGAHQKLVDHCKFIRSVHAVIRLRHRRAESDSVL